MPINNCYLMSKEIPFSVKKTKSIFNSAMQEMEVTWKTSARNSASSTTRRSAPPSPQQPAADAAGPVQSRHGDREIREARKAAPQLRHHHIPQDAAGQELRAQRHESAHLHDGHAALAHEHQLLGPHGVRRGAGLQ